MLSEEQLLLLPDAVQGHFIEMERKAIARITRHIGEIGKITPTDLHLLTELNKVGFNMVEMQKDIAKTLNLAETTVFEVFERASFAEYETSKSLFSKKLSPLKENQAVKDLVSRSSRQMADAIKKVADPKTMKLLDVRGNAKSVAEVYRQKVDFAVTQAKLGQETFTESVRSTVKNLADRGIVSIQHESGRIERIDSAVRRNTLGGLADLSARQAETIAKEVGADGYEITWHSGHRPSHYFGGMQFTIPQFEQEIESFMLEANCYHRKFPIIIGVSPRTYNDAQLNQFREDQEKPRYFENKAYTQYEAHQKQRRYERAIRQQKDRINALEAAGDKQAVKEAKAKLKVLNTSYKDFSKEVGLKPRPERTRI